jgi:hypothetical protein
VGETLSPKPAERLEFLELASTLLVGGEGDFSAARLRRDAAALVDSSLLEYANE